MAPGGLVCTQQVAVRGALPASGTYKSRGARYAGVPPPKKPSFLEKLGFSCADSPARLAQPAAQQHADFRHQLAGVRVWAAVEPAPFVRQAQVEAQLVQVRVGGL